MINLIRFLIRNGSIFLFVLFEFIALYLVVNYNQTQRASFVNASSKLTGELLEYNDRLADYFNLKSINEQVNNENAYLLNKLHERNALQQSEDVSRFSFKSAKVISNQIDSRYNRFLINQGRSNGVQKGMGVVSNDFPVGVVYRVTQDYASVVSLLNINLNLSVKIKGSGYFGSMTWRPPITTKSVLQHIPAYVDVAEGDTIVTSGYSRVFPADMPVGIVNEVTTPKGSASHVVGVKLFPDVSRLEYVHVVEPEDAAEIDSLTLDVER